MSKLQDKKDCKIENDRYYICALQALKQLFTETSCAWQKWIETDIKEYLSTGSVQHHLKAYGGMGSINDIWICKVNNHTINDEAEPWINELMEYLKGISYGIAHMIKDEKKINIEKIFSANYTRKILTVRQCKSCGFSEIRKRETDSYLASLLLPNMTKEAILENKTEELISACLLPDIPNLLEERERIIKLIEQSGIGFSASEKSCCKKCGGDTGIGYWKLDGNIFKPY
ncbi:DUF6966 domain-containing protein [Treponema pedis]|uniref:DUF6966 domain-containing protein n=1 Tax=Treponema pedis TaxID=409322 RepID=UPI003D23595D